MPPNSRLTDTCTPPRTQHGAAKPLVVGNDLSGVVSDVGAQVTRFKKGDAIYARLEKDRIGAFAQFAVVRESAAALKPSSVTFEQAASLPLVALTAWQALVEIGKLGVA